MRDLLSQRHQRHDKLPNGQAPRSFSSLFIKQHTLTQELNVQTKHDDEKK
jgi:hypothetical protein